MQLLKVLHSNKKKKRTNTTKPKKHNKTKNIGTKGGHRQNAKAKQQESNLNVKVNPKNVQDKETDKQTVQCKLCNKLLPMDKHILVKHKKDHRDGQ